MSAEPRTVEDAVEEYLARRRRGEPIDAAAYVARHPELGAPLAEALESLECLERVRAASLAGACELPRRVGAFRVVREIGRGGMGIVCEAIEEPLGRRVALKLLSPDGLWSAAARARFRREAEIASRLDHPGICTVYAAGVEQDQPWIAMRLVEGRTLAQHVASARRDGARGLALRAGVASSRERALAVAACIARVARALQYAHERGVLHRDIKPSNVMITPAGDPILLDFGLARDDGSDSAALTQPGHATGTPAYLAPETIAGEVARPDARCDVYALGVTLHECLALRPPFERTKLAALYRAIVAGHAQHLDARRLDLPRDLVVVTETAMERDRARRYATAAELAAELEAVVESRPIAARPVGAAGRAARWARREPRQAWLAAALVLTALALAALGARSWSARERVLAAQGVTNARALEDAVSRGFFELDWSHDDAEAAFRRALEIDPANVDARAGLVLVSLRRDRPGEALARLAEAPDAPLFARLRAMALGEPLPEDPEWLAIASAFELFVEAQRLQLELDRGPVSERRRALRRPLAYFTEAVIRAPAPRPIYFLERAYTAGRAGDVDAARSSVAALVELWPDWYPALVGGGAALLEVDPAPAVEILERAARISPDDPRLLLALGSAYEAVDRPLDAERTIRRALEQGVHDERAYNVLGLALGDLGRNDEARDAYRQAIELAPDMFEAWANLGDLEFRAGDFAASLRANRRAVELDPEDPGAHHDCGNALFFLGETDRALEEFEAALALDPQFVHSIAGVAWCLHREGKHEEALAVIEEGLRIDATHPPLLDVQREARAALEWEQ